MQMLPAAMRPARRARRSRLGTQELPRSCQAPVGRPRGTRPTWRSGEAGARAHGHCQRQALPGLFYNTRHCADERSRPCSRARILATRSLAHKHTLRGRPRTRPHCRAQPEFIPADTGSKHGKASADAPRGRTQPATAVVLRRAAVRLGRPGRAVSRGKPPMRAALCSCSSRSSRYGCRRGLAPAHGPHAGGRGLFAVHG